MKSLEQSGVYSIEESIRKSFEDSLADRIFDETQLYRALENYAEIQHLYQTKQILPYARKQHEGQFRKGKEKVPYIYHPLLVACHAAALGFSKDTVLSAALLHDVCEDCGVAVCELPVNEETKKIVALLTKDKEQKNEQEYYAAISKNADAAIVKLLDRCSNVSDMAAGFSKQKIVQYIKETEKYFYPLAEKTERAYPQYAKQIFLIRYHMRSVLEALKHQG